MFWRSIDRKFSPLSCVFSFFHFLSLKICNFSKFTCNNWRPSTEEKLSSQRINFIVHVCRCFDSLGISECYRRSGHSASETRVSRRFYHQFLLSRSRVNWIIFSRQALFRVEQRSQIESFLTSSKKRNVRWKIFIRQRRSGLLNRFFFFAKHPPPR